MQVYSGVIAPLSPASSNGDRNVLRALEFVVASSSSCGRSVIVLNVFEDSLSSSSSSLSLFSLGLGDLLGGTVFFASSLLPNAI